MVGGDYLPTYCGLAKYRLGKDYIPIDLVSKPHEYALCLIHLPASYYEKTLKISGFQNFFCLNIDTPTIL